MRVLVSAATPLQIDWAVAQCERDRVFRIRLGRPDDWDGATYRAGDTSDERWVVRAQVPNVGWFADYTYNPSTNPAQGQPILERECISTLKVGVINWKGTLNYGGPGGFDQYGPTMLLAGLRCYVASKLGDEVEVPEELC